MFSCVGGQSLEELRVALARGSVFSATESRVKHRRDMLGVWE